MFLGFANVATDASCNGSIALMVPNAAITGSVVTATATDPNGNTSEFSSCVPVGVPATNLVQFSAPTFNVTEACTSIALTVNRSGDTSGAATVNTRPPTALPLNAGMISPRLVRFRSLLAVFKECRRAH